MKYKKIIKKIIKNIRLQLGKVGSLSSKNDKWINDMLIYYNIATSKNINKKMIKHWRLMPDLLFDPSDDNVLNYRKDMLRYMRKEKLRKLKNIKNN